MNKMFECMTILMVLHQQIRSVVLFSIVRNVCMHNIQVLLSLNNLFVVNFIHIPPRKYKVSILLIEIVIKKILQLNSFMSHVNSLNRIQFLFTITFREYIDLPKYCITYNIKTNSFQTIKKV